MMKSPVHIYLCVLFLVGLASCDVPTSLPQVTSNPDIALQVRTVSVILTATAGAVVPSPDPTIGVVNNPLPTSLVVTVLPTDTPPASPAVITSPQKPATPAPPCDLAQPGRPIDVTVPDDTRLSPGQMFSKTWRLVNAPGPATTPSSGFPATTWA